MASIAVVLTLMSNRKNLSQGRESVDVTYLKIVNVASASYSDSENKYFRIKNITSDTIYLNVIGIDNSDTVRWCFTPGWNPEVIKKIVTSETNTVTTVYIGQ